MKVLLGKEGLEMSWQAEFPETVQCVHCGGLARIGFVAYEGMEEDNKEGPLVRDLHQNEGKDRLWLHDCCAAAVYFCVVCLNTTALYNQA